MQIEIKLIDEVRQFYKLYSVWVFSALICLPDLYNQAIASGVITQDKVPPFFSHLVSTISFMGLAMRFIKQKKDTTAPASIASELLTPGEPTPGVAIVSPIPANVQEALTENDLIAEHARVRAEGQAAIDKTHVP